MNAYPETLTFHHYLEGLESGDALLLLHGRVDAGRREIAVVQQPNRENG